MIDEFTLKTMSKKFGIDRITILREYIQILFLKNLFNTKGSEDVFFKGGTAIHLLLKSPRFSEDLDFTSNVGIEKLENIVKKAVSLSKKEIPGISADRFETSKQVLKSKILYKDDLKYPVSIKLDFSLREIPLTKQHVILETQFPFPYLPVIPCLDWEEILAEKIRAMLTRAKGRDLFDIYFLLSKGIHINESFVKEKLKFYNLKYDPEDLIEKVNSFGEALLKRDLGKFLPPAQRKIIPLLRQVTAEKLKEALNL